MRVCDHNLLVLLLKLLPTLAVEFQVPQCPSSGSVPAYLLKDSLAEGCPDIGTNLCHSESYERTRTSGGTTRTANPILRCEVVLGAEWCNVRSLNRIASPARIGTDTAADVSYAAGSAPLTKLDGSSSSRPSATCGTTVRCEPGMICTHPISGVLSVTAIHAERTTAGSRGQ
eukprot:COSAG02_NODE_3202_length_7181_cov_25.177210_8_plen_172_part_00